jgi:hypothetical protein
MAQAKTKAKPSSKAKPKAKPKSSSKSTAKAKPKSRTKSSSKAKPKSRAKSAAKSRAGSNAKANSSGGLSKAGASLEKLKGPATVTGAALLAVAGGVAASHSRNGKTSLARGVSGKNLKKAVKKIDLPKADDAIDWVEEKAKGLGEVSYKVAEASSQARSAKKAVSRK